MRRKGKVVMRGTGEDKGKGKGTGKEKDDNGSSDEGQNRGDQGGKGQSGSSSPPYLWKENSLIGALPLFFLATVFTIIYFFINHK